MMHPVHRPGTMASNSIFDSFPRYRFSRVEITNKDLSFILARTLVGAYKQRLVHPRFRNTSLPANPSYPICAL